MNLDRCLVVGRSGEDLRFRCRNRGVTRDDRCRHSSQGFDAERERRHVQEEHLADIALEDAGLNGGAHSHDLVRVHALVRLPAEKLLDGFLYLRHARLPADENHLAHLVRRQLRVLEGLAAGADRVLDQLADELLELGAR